MASLDFCNLFYYRIITAVSLNRQNTMLRVGQDQLAHQTNIAYVQIRQNELSYFQAFFSGFGLQSALLAGFNLSVISQTICKTRSYPVQFGCLYMLIA
jgi:NADH/NAD ratio-sensing transcriptional regulator Rex